ncbi:MAG: hypothetical protein K2U26_10250 [Cyclobacteriaceae bacterium]|nr:hypothetical protein [Cyclobacteriaceae bacterium]
MDNSPNFFPDKYFRVRVKKQSPKTKIFVFSILPTNDAVKIEYPDAFNKNDQAMKVNSKLKAQAKNKGYEYIDLYSKFLDTTGKLNVKYAYSDGLHLNAEGYALWVSVLRTLL